MWCAGGMYRCVGVSSGVRGCEQVCAGVPGGAQGCPGMRKCVLVYNGMCWMIFQNIYWRLES